MALRLLLLATCILWLQAYAVPTQVSPEEEALITPAPTRTLAVYGSYAGARRNVVSDLESDVDSYVNSIFSQLGTAIPSYVSNGLLPNLQNLPTGSAVMSSVGVSSSDLVATPTQVLNIPGYGNWTSSGWNLRIHGNVFKQPNISNATVDRLANFYLIGTSIEDLPPSQQAQARNLTREIYVVQQGNQTVTMDILPGPEFGSNGQPGGGGGVTPAGGEQVVTLPNPTTPEGDFDVFIPIDNNSFTLAPGTGDIAPQRLNVYAQGTDTGNATSYLVSDQGLTVISDIDDILRVTKIYEPEQGLLNSFARPFTPWMNMPDIYRNWSVSLPNMHFHYLTTTPEQITRNYMQFIYDTYPGGSFDTRPLNFSDVSATLSIRKFLLDKIFQTFPHRKFILIADTSNSDVMRDYPEMATQYPGQVQCIFLRNTSSTDPGDKFPYNTKGFKGLSQESYMFFKVPDDLMGLDIANGKCLNTTIPQNLTFGYQGLPFGLSTGNGKSGASRLLVDGGLFEKFGAVMLSVLCAMFLQVL
ncbi:hypothetical protein AYL99_07565 [Fonsecaea erecta]|uniref:Phosphatidate phosphatase APP1 catalytic domain-containing protein n=1 Tax=Fonsecaea erecta TaxID=1367422 RepID=A0A178ZHH9_9EURO|nr:hypothetical protein AYL99_07565 [Fonsecaea erecta]OAP58475.1 hypothetical protein AYL99_07565 [Fonsecaea erecta]